MPLIASLVRYVIMAAVQIGAFSAAQIFLEKAFNGIATFFVSTEGGTIDEAENAIAREIVSAGGAVGASALLIRSRLPVRWADKVSKAIGAGKMSPAGVSKVAAPTVSFLSTFRNFGYAGKLASALGLSFVASLPWMPSLIQNFLDQGTFNPTNANRALKAVGLGSVFQWPTAPKELQPGSYTAGEFIELFDQLTSAGAVGINNTFEEQSQIWDKGNLAQLINTIVGDLVIRGKKSDKTAIRAELAKYIVSKAGGGLPVAFSPSTVGAGVAVLPTRTATQIKLYTGVISEGALGTPAEFIARQDDMIEDVEELKAAAKNNLAAFVQALPGRFYYELAIVNTVKSRGGFSQKGSPVRIISSYNKDGTPRYKTIYHKFAVMQLGVLDENGRSVKLGKINLGPVNAVSFQPTATQLQDVAKLITPELFTSDISSVSSIITSSPVSVSATPPANPNPPTQAPAPVQTSAGVSPTPAIAVVAPVVTAPAPVPASPVPAPAPLPVAVRVYSATELKMRAATTLTEFYAALGSSLPALNMRAKYYAAAGLGAESTYVGSAEQNNRFLAWLKSSNGV